MSEEDIIVITDVKGKLIGDIIKEIKPDIIFLIEGDNKSNKESYSGCKIEQKVVRTDSIFNCTNDIAQLASNFLYNEIQFVAGNSDIGRAIFLVSNASFVNLFYTVFNDKIVEAHTNFNFTAHGYRLQILAALSIKDLNRSELMRAFDISENDVNKALHLLKTQQLIEELDYGNVDSKYTLTERGILVENIQTTFNDLKGEKKEKLLNKV